MARSASSAMDQALLGAIEAKGLRCSRYQLERWRKHGLLPRAEILRLGARGSAAEHPEGTLEIAEFLAEASARGRSWQYLALLLAEHDYFVDDSELQQAFLWLTGRQDLVMEKAVARVKDRLAAAGIDTPDALDVAEALVGQRGSRADRATLKLVVPVLRFRYPDLNRAQLNALARQNAVWNVTERLGDELHFDTRALAQGFESEEDAATAGWTSPGMPQRPSFLDQRAVAATVTGPEVWAVFNVVLAQIGKVLDDPRDVGGGVMSGMALRALTQCRCVWNEDPSRPLTPDQVDRIWESVDEMLDEDRDPETVRGVLRPLELAIADSKAAPRRLEGASCGPPGQ